MESNSHIEVYPLSTIFFKVSYYTGQCSDAYNYTVKSVERDYRVSLPAEFFASAFAVLRRPAGFMIKFFLRHFIPQHTHFDTECFSLSSG